MGKPAVPRYLGNDFAATPPGHRFGLYFSIWSSDQEEYELDRQDWINGGRRGREPESPHTNHDWILADRRKEKALRQVITIGDTAKKQLVALRQRQQAMAGAANLAVLAIKATSTAPFMTGTGMEHPLENGFAFLNPYGLPYLPGSSVKGVLRRAAEEMAGIDIDVPYPNPAGWTQDAIDVLFGKELPPNDDTSPRNRGVLCFWDVFPQPPGDTLTVEIMTPHYANYYQQGGTPSDDGQPTPIVFLALPPNSQFTFHVQCAENRLPVGLSAHWQALVQAAFAHAFDWLGFGAKTAVGYGQMAALEPAPNNGATAASIPTAELQQQRWENVVVNWSPGSQELKADHNGQKAITRGEAASKLMEPLSSKKARQRPLKLSLTVEHEQGSLWKIISID